MTPDRDDDRLTERQRRFVEAFLARGPGFLCATRAARIAGFAWPDKQGSRLMSFPRVAAVVEERFRALCGTGRM